MTAPVIDALALARLLRLVSPALPVGAYAYSQGLESAVEAGWVRDADSARDWLQALMLRSQVSVDLPALLRMQRAYAAADFDAYAHWNHWLLASRESAELHFEDTQLGAALWRLLDGLELPVAGRIDAPCSFAAAFVAACHAWKLPASMIGIGYLWCWLENQVSAATKLIPLGQTAAQRILEQLLPLLPDAVARAAALPDDELGASLPGLAWLSAQHETQYSRLFRS
jgi:urease accessory protein